MRKDKASRLHKGKPRRTTRRGALLPSVPFRIILPAKRGFVHRKIKKDKNFSVSRRFDASAGTLRAEDGAVYRQDPTSASRLASERGAASKTGATCKSGRGGGSERLSVSSAFIRDGVRIFAQTKDRGESPRSRCGIAPSFIFPIRLSRRPRSS